MIGPLLPHAPTIGRDRIGARNVSRRCHAGITMHELSLAQGILNIVKEHTSPQQLAAVRCVRVDVGRLAGVVAESLEFGFRALVAETALQEARLELNVVPLRLTCADCQATLESESDVFSCPACGGHQTTVVSGMELWVTEIELEEQPEEAT